MWRRHFECLCGCSGQTQSITGFQLAHRANKTSFKRGHKPIPGAGRAKGTPNKRTALLRDAILEAAAAEGSDGQGTDGLVGFLRHVARTELPVFCGLMRAVLPMQI